jgi:proteasome lid subunit RPN8/RPN11
MRTSAGALYTALDLAMPEIRELGERRRPVEACGLLLDVPWRRSDGKLSYIRELPNRSLAPASYRIEMDDVRVALEDLEEVEDIAIWHTHPSGFIGPSRGDMENRPLNTYMVVISLTDADPVATWF